MDFFGQQTLKRHHSHILLFGFVAALFAMGLIIHVVIASLSYLLGETESFLQPSTPAIALIALVWLTILAGGFFRALDVKAGGAVLAGRFGAVQASDRSRNDEEKQLLNIVAEISIAASTPQPEVFVLRHESSINAFVLGNESSRYVIVVTQGALDAYDRDEMQAVVAHEFGHIANGDLPLNMRLLIALGGLMAVDEVGRLLVGSDPNENAHPGMIVGYLLRALGSIGVFFGSLLRAAFSRQREYLADATAVQFTRNPFALASALSIIHEQQNEPALHSVHVQELAHLCFQSGKALPWYKRLLASHPKMQLRIDAIDPHFAVKRRKVTSSEKDEKAVTAGSAGEGASAGASSAQVVPLHSPIEANGLSDHLTLLLSGDSHCLAGLFALFASTDDTKQREYLNAISFGFNAQFAGQVKQLLASMPNELRDKKLTIIEHSTGVLEKSLSYESRQQVMTKLERLLTVSGDYDLINYATVQLIRRKLAVEFPIVEKIASEQTPVAQSRHVKTFDAMGEEFALLLSLMVESSGASTQVLDTEFERVLKCYTQAAYPRRTGAEAGIVEELESAFQTLYVQPKSTRQAFVQHCVEIMQQDGIEAGAEKSMLQLFAASLDCEELLAA
ncbi:MAG: M48 family metalloprotease [Granulosicoccus sp.]